MDERKFCVILTEDDLLPENITITLKTIQHNMSKFYLLAADIERPLWQIIEQMRKAIKKNVNLFTGVRIAYNLNFNLQTMLKTGDDLFAEGIEVKNFADLLELLDFDENLNLLRSDYHVIIDDDGIDSLDNDSVANRAVAEFFQQTALLNIDGLDIQKKSDAQTVTESRPIRIAVMGTGIKSGKSIVTSALLKIDYAPTSLTLPNPNTIKYVPATPNAKLTLEYDGKNYPFDTADELKNFINDEYERTWVSDRNLPDMTIYYPCDEFNGYEIWDTPGPTICPTWNFVWKAAHFVAKADVCIFVMNYSCHLTSYEVDFLRQIHEAVKTNSFVFVINRIDERYNDKSEKSVAAVIDYVTRRLEKFGYKNFVVFGTSALQSFYLDKVVELVKEDRAKAGEDIDALPIVDTGAINPLGNRHRNALTQIKFIKGALDNLDFFHSIENPTERELYALSGIPQLRRYVDYLGEQAQRRS